MLGKEQTCNRTVFVPVNPIQPFEKIGGRTRARTWDPLIKSQLLYQLSYAPGPPPAGSPKEGVV
jgi:hypothetical protein